MKKGLFSTLMLRSFWMSASLTPLRLKTYMIGTLAAVIAVSTLFFAIILSLLRALNILVLVSLVAVFNVAQWLLAPYLIEAVYQVREVKPGENPRLHGMVDRLARKSGLPKPKVMLANIPIPNAFAYGSPLTGYKVAVTRGLLNTLEDDEVEAVLGHELGHIKHRDVQIMMIASFLPSIFYIIGRSFLISAYYGPVERGREGEAASPQLIGALSIGMYFLLTLIVLGLSRLREYYADFHSASVVENGATKLSEALAKIVYSTGRMRMRYGSALAFSGFKPLFITDPDRSETDIVEMSTYARYRDKALVERLLRRRLTFIDHLMELFSTHPNVVKRLRALQAYA